MKISKNTCRLCAQIFEESLLESLFSQDEEIEIANKVFDISGVFIEKNEEFMPKKICKHCKSKLQISYEFIINCQKSDVKLKALLSTEEEIENKSIKHEVNSDSESNFLNLNCQTGEWQADLFHYENIEKAEYIENDVANEQQDKEAGKNRKRERVPSKKLSNESVSNEDDDEEFAEKNKVRRYCTFKKKWMEKYEWIKPAKNNKNAFCTVCNCEFSIAYGGESVLSRHMTRNKHMYNANPDLKKEKIFRGNGVKCPKKSEDLTFIMCEVCGNKYPTKRHLKRHLKYHSDVMDYECEICKKQFREMMQLKRHMRTHTGERPYPCHYCDKRFGDYSTRIKHERVHTNERPYVCTTCGKAFTYANILKNHILVHTGEKPFKCETCDASFARKTHLKAHFTSNLHKSRLQEATSNPVLS